MLPPQLSSLEVMGIYLGTKVLSTQAAVRNTDGCHMQPQCLHWTSGLANRPEKASWYLSTAQLSEVGPLKKG